jgi:ankyrin repeat protein
MLDNRGLTRVACADMSTQVDLALRDVEGRNVLHHALACEHNREVVALLLDHTPFDIVNDQDPKGNT